MSDRLELISRIQGESDTGDTVVLVNISQGGLFVHTDHELAVGETHEFRFHLRHGPTLLFAAKVVRVQRLDAAGDLRFGIGLAFEEFSTARQRQSIDAIREFGGLLPLFREPPPSRS